jgi:hypothetical protein
MPDPHIIRGPTPASPREVDAECRGIGEPRPRASAGRLAPTDGVRTSIPADVPVELPVAREAVRVAVAEAVTYQALKRVVDLRGLGTADDAAVAEEPGEAPSPELVRLLGHLRSTITRFVCKRREAGVPVERMVPEVKGLVREAASCEAWVDPGDTLVAQVVRWAITAYYDACSDQPEPAHVPRLS